MTGAEDTEDAVQVNGTAQPHEANNWSYKKDPSFGNPAAQAIIAESRQSTSCLNISDEDDDDDNDDDDDVIDDFGEDDDCEDDETIFAEDKIIKHSDDEESEESEEESEESETESSSTTNTPRLVVPNPKSNPITESLKEINANLIKNSQANSLPPESEPNGTTDPTSSNSSKEIETQQVQPENTATKSQKKKKEKEDKLAARKLKKVKSSELSLALKASKKKEKSSSKPRLSLPSAPSGSSQAPQERPKKSKRKMGRLSPRGKKSPKKSLSITSTTDNNVQLRNYKPSNRTDFRNSRMMRIVRVTKECKGTDPTELTLNVGDIVVLRGIPEHGWCEGESSNGQIGWFPVTACDELKAEVQKEAAVQQKEAVEPIEGVDARSIVSQKHRITMLIERKLRKRPTNIELINKNILHSSADQSANTYLLSKGIEHRNRAEVLTQLLDGRRTCTADDDPASDGSLSFRKDTTTTTDDTDLSETSDDDTESQSVEEQAVLLFQTKPAKAVNMLIENGVIKGEPEDIAKYLHNNPRLNGQMIGDYLGDYEEINKKVLRAFLDQMDFSGMTFDKALRNFLFVFRLPVESQKIDRIIEAFATKYFSQYSGNVFHNQDCVYTLAFATLMLNTDLHHPQVKKKMTAQEFVNINHGINGGHDLSSVYLEDLYQQILEEEIKTKDDNFYPKAAKRGFLFTERRAHLRKKKLVKLWWVLDPESKALYGFKSELDHKPVETYFFKHLVMKEKQEPKVIKGRIPLKFKYTDPKPIEVTLFAGSKRLWVDWLTILSEVLAM